MRIAFVTNSLTIGGFETNLVRLTRTLTRRGHSITVISAEGQLSAAVAEAGGRSYNYRSISGAR